MKFFEKTFLAAIALLLISTAGCVQENATAPTGAAEGNAVITHLYTGTDGGIISIEIIETEIGSNAFNAIKENVDIEFDEFDFGVMVNSIAGTPAPEGHYLGLYINGEYASKGIADYTVEENMLIEWKTEKIEDFGLE